MEGENEGWAWEGSFLRGGDGGGDEDGIGGGWVFSVGGKR